MVLGDPADLLQGVQATMPGTVGTKRKNYDILAPWELLAAKALVPGKRCKLDEAASYEQLWNYMKEPPGGNTLYKSELCSKHAYVRGSVYPAMRRAWKVSAMHSSTTLTN